MRRHGIECGGCERGDQGVSRDVGMGAGRVVRPGWRGRRSMSTPTDTVRCSRSHDSVFQLDYGRDFRRRRRLRACRTSRVARTASSKASSSLSPELCCAARMILPTRSPSTSERSASVTRSAARSSAPRMSSGSNSGNTAKISRAVIPLPTIATMGAAGSFGLRSGGWERGSVMGQGACPWSIGRRAHGSDGRRASHGRAHACADPRSTAPSHYPRTM